MSKAAFFGRGPRFHSIAASFATSIASDENNTTGSEVAEPTVASNAASAIDTIAWTSDVHSHRNRQCPQWVGCGRSGWKADLTNNAAKRVPFAGDSVRSPGNVRVPQLAEPE